MKSGYPIDQTDFWIGWQAAVQAVEQRVAGDLIDEEAVWRFVIPDREANPDVRVVFAERNDSAQSLNVYAVRRRSSS